MTKIILKRKSKIFLASIILLILIVFGIAAFVCMEGHGFDFSAYQKIQLGMTETQVQTIMGNRSSTSKLDDGITVWIFTRNWNWCIGYIFFDNKGNVKYKEHDH